VSDIRIDQSSSGTIDVAFITPPDSLVALLICSLDKEDGHTHGHAQTHVPHFTYTVQKLLTHTALIQFDTKAP